MGEHAMSPDALNRDVTDWQGQIPVVFRALFGEWAADPEDGSVNTKITPDASLPASACSIAVGKMRQLA